MEVNDKLYCHNTSYKPTDFIGLSENEVSKLAKNALGLEKGKVYKIVHTANGLFNEVMLDNGIWYDTRFIKPYLILMTELRTKKLNRILKWI